MKDGRNVRSWVYNVRSPWCRLPSVRVVDHRIAVREGYASAVRDYEQRVKAGEDLMSLLGMANCPKQHIPRLLVLKELINTIAFITIRELDGYLDGFKQYEIVLEDVRNRIPEGLLYFHYERNPQLVVGRQTPRFTWEKNGVLVLTDETRRAAILISAGGDPPAFAGKMLLLGNRASGWYSFPRRVVDTGLQAWLRGEQFPTEWELVPQMMPQRT